MPQPTHSSPLKLQFPGAHASHPDCLALGALPAAHWEHEPAFAALEYLFDGHGMQLVDALLSWSYLPAVQLVHTVAPALAYAPTSQGEHCLALVALLARPAGHRAQTVAPAPANVPVPHAKHAVLAFLSVSARPAAHTSHALALALDTVPCAHAWHLVLGSASPS